MMNWRTLLFEHETGRLRCWWRALVFLVATVAVALAFTGIFAMPVFMTVTASQQPMTAAFRSIGPIFFFSLPIAGILVSFWALRTLEGLPPATLGIAMRGPWLRVFLASLGMGGILFLLLIGVLCLGGFASCATRPLAHSDWQALLPVGVLILLFAFAMEILSHGYLFQTLLRGTNPVIAVLTIAVLGMTVKASLLSGSPLALVNTLVMTVLLGMAYLRFGALWAPSGISAGWLLGALLFDYPGNLLVEAVKLQPPFSITLSGPSLITGGSLGVESGVAASVLLLGALAAITYSRFGLPLESRWWDWRQLSTAPALPPAWDFSIGERHYQWRLLAKDASE